MRLLFLIYFLLPLYVFSVQGITDKEESYTITEQNGNSYKIELVYQQEQPMYFTRNVFTPVCSDDVCKPVRIQVYWDLLGNYQKFEVPMDEPLTKMDHAEFDKADYEKLHEILANKNSLLKDLGIDELVDPTEQGVADSIDAVTGATKKTIQNEVIAGALYSCYTLWHIVNGEVVDNMLRITSELLDKELLQRFFASDHYPYRYWAIDRVIDTSGAVDDTFKKEVFDQLRSANVFVARYTLRKLNKETFNDEADQLWLWKSYRKAAYPMKMDILDKMASVDLLDVLTTPLIAQLSEVNQESFLKIIKLLSRQKQLSERQLKALSTYLKEQDRKRAVAVYKLLSERKESISMNIQEQLNKFETEY